VGDKNSEISDVENESEKYCSNESESKDEEIGRRQKVAMKRGRKVSHRNMGLIQCLLLASYSPTARTEVRCKSKKCKAIPVTGCGGPYDCETSRLTHFVDNRLTDGGEIVSLTRRPPFTPTKIPGTHFF
jgi:hypothetical protein